MHKYKNLDLFSIIKNTQIKTPIYLDKVSAGFPSPATDYMENKLDLNEHLIKHRAATFIVKASGSSMINAGIYSEDLLIVDRSLTPKNNHIVIASISDSRRGVL
jgi:SOS-response transcriptional repressors (RecA-mediated autopeptidases)